MNIDSTPQIERLRSVLTKTGLSRSTLYARIDQGLFVPQVSLGGRAVGWPSNETDLLIQAMIEGRSTDGIKQLVTSLVSQRTSNKTNHA